MLALLPLLSITFFKTLFVSNLYTQWRAQTPNPKTESWTLDQLSQLGTLLIGSFQLLVSFSLSYVRKSFGALFLFLVCRVTYFLSWFLWTLGTKELFAERI